jgi:hypothetical protein
MSVTVIIASIPPRFKGRKRAINSSLNQTMRPDNVLVNIDFSRRGAAETRDMLLKAVDTKYVCILDDDDWLLPHHIETLYTVAEEHNADLVYPWHKLSIGDQYGSHLERWRGVPWDDSNMHQVPITWMAKTASLRKVGGFSSNFDTLSNNLDQDGNRIGEDYLMLHKMVDRGMKIVHVNEVTWVWNWDGDGTHGRPDRW